MATGPSTWWRGGLVVLLAAGALATSGLALRPPHTDITPLPTPTARADDAPAVVVVLATADLVPADPTTPTSWTGQLAASRGWEVTVLPSRGAGYLAPDGCADTGCDTFAAMIPEVQALDPDVVIVAGGAASGTTDLSELDSAIRTTFAGLRVALPDARLVPVGPLPATEPAGPMRLDSALRQSASALGLGYASLTAPPVVLSPDATLDDAANADVARRVGSQVP
jgi:hypothetical protein